MSDGEAFDNLCKAQAALVNATATDRPRLEAHYGKVWDTQQLREEFEVLGFCAPFVMVRRKADGVKGTLEFQHHPRYYYDFQAM